MNRPDEAALDIDPVKLWFVEVIVRSRNADTNIQDYAYSRDAGVGVTGKVIRNESVNHI